MRLTIPNESINPVAVPARCEIWQRLLPRRVGAAGITPIDWNSLRTSLFNNSDRSDINECPWYRGDFGCDENVVNRQDLTHWIKAWCGSRWQIEAIAVRIITAARLNDWCQSRGNKSDLLSSASCELAQRLMQSIPPVAQTARLGSPRVDVRCDRHGGRRYYSGVLLNATGSMPRPIAEMSRCSEYEIDAPGGPPVRWSFTVGGDSFAPVAVSSIIAKWLRELAMARLNQYFAGLHRGHVGTKSPPNSTAGYHVDAARFLAEHRETFAAAGIDPQRLIRIR